MANSFADYASVVRHLGSRLLVADLKEILKDLSLSTSGNKKPLIERITNQLNLYKATNDVAKYNMLKSKIMHGAPPVSRPEHGMPWGRPAGNAFPLGPPNAAPRFMTNGYNHAGPHVSSQAPLQFAQSPFYEIKERLSHVVQLPFASRNSVPISFVLSAGTLDLLLRDPLHHKVALMGGNLAMPGKAMLMEFPSPAELTVNGRRVSSNLRGMKNKPGTIPPVNITSNTDKTPKATNRIEIVYASGSDTTKRFSCQVMFLKVQTVDELVARIRAGRRFTKEAVLQKLQKPSDDDIQLGSFDLSLKDPLSYMRISLPCRSVNCKHQQCFDAYSFLSMNEQTPQWICSICQLHIPSLEMLAVDGYFEDILQKVDDHVDTIAVDAQGHWSIAGSEESSEAKHTDTPEPRQILDLDDSSDSSPHPKVKPEEEPISLPPVSKASMVPRLQEESRPSTPNSKRKQVPICIDLTEDSDEEMVSPKKIKVSNSMNLDLQTPILPKPFQVPTSAHAWPTQPDRAQTLPPPPQLQHSAFDQQSMLSSQRLDQFRPFPSFSPKSIPQDQLQHNLPTLERMMSDSLREPPHLPSATEPEVERVSTPVQDGSNGTHESSPPIVTPGSRTRTSAPQFPFDSDDFSDVDGTVY